MTPAVRREIAAARTLKAFLEGDGAYPFGEVLRCEGEANPHGVEVTLPEDAFPIVSDYLSRYTTYGALRSAVALKYARHRGVDIAAPIGTPVIAAADGVVVRSALSEAHGERVEVEHAGTAPSAAGAHAPLRTSYVHLEKRLVEVGGVVRRGQVIGTVGVTGKTAAKKVPHLHFGLAGRDASGGGKWRTQNPHEHWFDGPGRVALFKPPRDYALNPRGLTYPVPGRGDLARYLAALDRPR